MARRKYGSVRHNTSKVQRAAQHPKLRVVNARIYIERSVGSYGTPASFVAHACLVGRKPGARKNIVRKMAPRGGGRLHERDRCGWGRGTSPTAATKKALRNLASKKL